MASVNGRLRGFANSGALYEYDLLSCGVPRKHRALRLACILALVAGATQSSLPGRDPSRPGKPHVVVISNASHGDRALRPSGQIGCYSARYYRMCQVSRRTWAHYICDSLLNYQIQYQIQANEGRL